MFKHQCDSCSSVWHERHSRQQSTGRVWQRWCRRMASPHAIHPSTVPSMCKHAVHTCHATTSPYSSTHPSSAFCIKQATNQRPSSLHICLNQRSTLLHTQHQNSPLSTPTSGLLGFIHPLQLQAHIQIITAPNIQLIRSAAKQVHASLRPQRLQEALHSSPRLLLPRPLLSTRRQLLH